VQVGRLLLASFREDARRERGCGSATTDVGDVRANQLMPLFWVVAPHLPLYMLLTVALGSLQWYTFNCGYWFVGPPVVRVGHVARQVRSPLAHCYMAIIYVVK
jgi:hypothetical protein